MVTPGPSARLTVSPRWWTRSRYFDHLERRTALIAAMTPHAARPPRNARPAARVSWLMAGILGCCGKPAFIALPCAEVMHGAVGDELGQSDGGGDLALGGDDVV